MTYVWDYDRQELRVYEYPRGLIFTITYAAMQRGMKSYG